MPDSFPAPIFAGVLPYYALPDTVMWHRALLRLRLLGCHAVVIPIPWSYHSPARGYHDFSDIRNLSLLLDEIEQVGMWAIPQIGPWVQSGLSGGGVPGWLWRHPELITHGSEYSEVFLRELADWWHRLNATFSPAKIILGTLLHPYEDGLVVQSDAALTQMLVLAQEAGFTSPYGLWEEPSDGKTHVHWLRSAGTWPVVNLQSASTLNDSPAAPGLTEVRRTLIDANLTVQSGVVLQNVLPELHWGWVYHPPVSQQAQRQPESPSHNRFLQLRQNLMQVEITLPLLHHSAPLTQTSAIPPGPEIDAWHNVSGTVVYVHNNRHHEVHPRIALRLPSHDITTSELSLEPDGAHLIYAAMALRGGQLLYNTLDIVLRTEVAGRELLALRNDNGGEIRLSDDFRVRHSKGDVYAERIMLDHTTELSVHFDPGRLASLLLDGPDGPLQILAVDAKLSLRLWHLDDSWRVTRMPDSPWTLDIDTPARGIILGPEYVIPEKDGGLSYLIRDRGYGYRWGPWRGSNPDTWLAPLIWGSPHSVQLPELVWQTKPGVPEVSPDYDDFSWRKIASGAELDVESLDIDGGFVWYRGRFSGMTDTLDLACAHAADVFLNGKHIASINPSPDFSPPTIKRFTLAPSLVNDENILAILTETMGRVVSSELTQRHGLLHCSLGSGQTIVWTYRAGLLGEYTRQGVSGYADWTQISGSLAGKQKSDVIVWHRAEFALKTDKTIEIELYLELIDVPVKVYVYLNGLLVGRTMSRASRKQTFPLPYELLNDNGKNELLVAQWTRGASPGIGSARLVAGEIFGWQKA